MIWREAAWVGLARGVALAAGLGTSILTARLLGPEGRGELYLAIMLAALASQFGSLGVHAANTWQVAREPALLARLTGNSLWVSLVAGGLAAAIAVTAAGAAADAAPGRLLLAAVVALAPLQLLILLLGNLLVGVGRAGSYAALQVAAACASLAAAMVAGLVGATAAAVLWLMAGFNLLVVIAALGSIHARTRLPLRFDRPLFTAGVRYAVRAFAIGVLGFLATRASAFVLGLVADREQVGYFSVASQFFDVLTALPASLAVVLLPRLVRVDAGWRDTQRLAAVVGASLAAAAALLWLFAAPLIEMLFGPAFVPGAPVLRALLPAAVLYAVTSILSQYPAAHGMPPIVIWTWLLAVPLAWGGAWLLAVPGGAVGAGLAASVTFGFVTVAMLLVGRSTERRLGLQSSMGAAQ